MENKLTEDLTENTTKDLTIESTQLTKESTQSAKQPEQTKKSKKHLTSYWGIELTNEVFENKILKELLESNKELIKLEKIHSTLLFVGKVDTMQDKENLIAKYVGKECKLTIDAIGYSENACALKVKNIKLLEADSADSAGSDIPSYATQQHVTVALKKGTVAKDSVLTLTTDKGKIINLEEELALKGKVKRYMY